MQEEKKKNNDVEHKTASYFISPVLQIKFQ